MEEGRQFVSCTGVQLGERDREAGREREGGREGERERSTGRERESEREGFRSEGGMEVVEGRSGVR